MTSVVQAGYLDEHDQRFSTRACVPTLRDLSTYSYEVLTLSHRLMPDYVDRTRGSNVLSHCVEPMLCAEIFINTSESW
jgi:hypothetical protein